MTCHAGDKAISNFRDQYVSNLRINLTRNTNVRTSLHNYRRKIFERHLVYDLPIFNCMPEHSTTDLKKTWHNVLVHTPFISWAGVKSWLMRRNTCAQNACKITSHRSAGGIDQMGTGKFMVPNANWRLGSWAAISPTRPARLLGHALAPA